MNPQILETSLSLLQGISSHAEIALYRRGIATCKHLADRAGEIFSARKAKIIQDSYPLVRKAISCNAMDILVNRLPVGLRCRAVYASLDSTLFYDIETDGLGKDPLITCITALFRGKLTTYVRDVNFWDFLDVWSKADVLVTFNGKRFDTPVVAKTFGISKIPAQVDLMDEAAYYGLRGGLKAIEPFIGFRRKNQNIADGKAAAECWEAYCKGDGDKLDLLKTYNQDDVLSLYSLYVYLLRRSVENTPIRLDL